MNVRSNLRRLVIIAFVSIQIFAAAGDAQQLPKSVTVGTNPAGTVFYAVGGGLASVISGGAPFQAVIQPYTGSSTFLPLLDNGEIDFGIINAVEMNLAYQGAARFKIAGRNPLPHVPNTRLIMRGSPLRVSPCGQEGLDHQDRPRCQRQARDWRISS